MLSILNNVAATAAENQMSITNANMQKTLQQLSSGQRINSGADDAAGLSIADGLNANVAALNQSAQNATTGIGELQVADGALAQVTSLLNRAVTLATEAANSGLTTAQHAALNNEFTSIKTEIDNIGQTTTYNGSAIFGGGAGSGSTQATNPNTLVSGAIDSTATATNAETASGKLVVDVGGKTLTFTPGTGETVGNFVNDINSQSTANGDGIQASVNSSGQLILTDTLDRGNIAIDKTSTFKTTVGAGGAGSAAAPTFANQGLENLNVQEGAAGVSADTVVNPLTTGGVTLGSSVWSAATAASGDLAGGVDPTKASGVLELSTQPTSGTSLELGGKTYTFETTASAAGQVQIGSNELQTMQNLASVINGTDPNNTTANTLISAGTPVDQTPGVNTDALLTITAKLAGVANGTAAGLNNDVSGTTMGWQGTHQWDAGTGNVASDGTAASATLTLGTAMLAAGSSINIGNSTYTFAAGTGQTQSNVGLGNSVSDTIANLVAAIAANGSDTSVTAVQGVGNPESVTFTANTNGVAGNQLAANGTADGTGTLKTATVDNTTENLLVTAGGTTQTFQVAAGATVSDVMQTINNAGTGIVASQDAATGKLVLTDTQDNGDITVQDNAGGALVNNLSGETLGGTPNGDGTFTQTNGFTNTELMTSSNSMSIFLSDSTETGTSTVNVALNTFSSSNLGAAGQGIAGNDLTTTSDAATALTAINAAISNVSALRGNIGAGVNQLQAASNVISSQTQNLTTASSNITSADVSQTVANMTEYSILSQTGMAALAQANQMQKGILTLLQG